MSRRMDREGVHRMEPQAVLNRRHWNDPRCVENERGWVQPFANWQGWQALNLMSHYRYRLMALRHHMSAWQRADELHSFRWNLKQSRMCDRPVLP